MLSNHLQNGIEAPKIAWSRLPSSEGGAEPDAVGLMKKSDDGGVESLDYEVIENYAYWDEQAQRGKLYVGYHVMVKWFFALLIGIGTGLAAVFINIAVENFAGWKFALTFAIIQKLYVAGFVVYILINLVLVFSSVYIVTQFAPAAAGSGIPEIKGYLNGVDIHGVLLFRTLVGKGGSTKYHLSSRWLQIFNSDRDRRDLLECLLLLEIPLVVFYLHWKKLHRGGRVNLCGVYFLLLLSWLSWCVL